MIMEIPRVTLILDTKEKQKYIAYIKQKEEKVIMGLTSTHVLVHPVLIDGPYRRHVSRQQLRQRHVLVTGPGTDQPGFTDCCVADDHALDQLLVWLLIIHNPLPRPRTSALIAAGTS